MRPGKCASAHEKLKFYLDFRAFGNCSHLIAFISHTQQLCLSFVFCRDIQTYDCSFISFRSSPSLFRHRRCRCHPGNLRLQLWFNCPPKNTFEIPNSWQRQGDGRFAGNEMNRFKLWRVRNNCQIVSDFLLYEGIELITSNRLPNPPSYRII